MRSRQGNALHYGLSMFLELGNVWQGFQNYLEWLLIEQRVYQPEAVLKMIPYLINLKEAIGKTCEI